MGDHRVSIEIKFRMHGVEEKADCWWNWSDDIPQRIATYIEEWQQKAMAKFYEEDAEYRAEKRREAEKQIEDNERAMLAKLKEKYE